MKSNTFESNLAKPIFTLLLGIGLLCVRIESVDAHRVNLFAWIEGDTVYVESSFSGGKRVNAGKITVLDPDGTELLRGTTDDNGKFSFKMPKKTELKIVLQAGAGHRAEWTLAAGEIEMPITEKRQAAEKGLPVKNIFVGLGCIFGLAAIVAYIRKRWKKDRG